MLILLIVVVSAASGGGGTPAPTRARHAASRSSSRSAKGRPRSVAAAPVRLSYRPLWSLPAPLRDPATASLSGSRFVMLGGLDASDVSTSEVDVADLHGIVRTATLPLAQHDAEAATLGGRVYAFGGGSASELNHILAYDPLANQVTQVGTLAVPQSDVGVAQVGGTAYIVGGYDGTNYLNTIVGWRPGGAPRVQARLPVGLRYAAVAPVPGGLLVIGGSSPAGAGRAIYRFDAATRRVTQIGTLPHPVTHGGAATLGSFVYLVGGRGDADTAQTADIWAIDPRTGRVTAAGRLPQPLSDAAVVSAGRGIVVAGGLTRTGATQASVGELVP